MGKRQVFFFFFFFWFNNVKCKNLSSSAFSIVCTCNALLPLTTKVLVYRHADHMYTFFVKLIPKNESSLEGFNEKHITVPWLCFYCGLHKIFYLHSYP